MWEVYVYMIAGALETKGIRSGAGGAGCCEPPGMGARGNPLKQLSELSEVLPSSKPLFSKKQDMKNIDKLKYFEGEEAFA